MTYAVTLSRQARRTVEDELPEAVAVACAEFIAGPLAATPHRVGQQLRAPMYPLFSARRGEFRIIYAIQQDRVLVHVVSIRHRRDAYRT